MKSRPKSSKKEKDMSISERVYDLIKQLTKLQSSIYFRKPVDVIEFKCPNYYDIIKNPMDLQTIMDKLLDGKYTKLQQIKLDIELIIQNCKYYNPNPENPVRKICQKFEQCYENRWTSFEQICKEQNYDDTTMEISNQGLKELEIKDQFKREDKINKIKQLNENIIPVQTISREFSVQQQDPKIIIQKMIEQKQKQVKVEENIQTQEPQKITLKFDKNMIIKQESTIQNEICSYQEEQNNDIMIELEPEKISPIKLKLDENQTQFFSQQQQQKPFERDPIFISLDFKKYIEDIQQIKTKKIFKYNQTLFDLTQKVVKFLQQFKAQDEQQKLLNIVIQEGQLYINYFKQLTKKSDKSQIQDIQQTVNKINENDQIMNDNNKDENQIETKQEINLESKQEINLEQKQEINLEQKQEINLEQKQENLESEIKDQKQQVEEQLFSDQNKDIKQCIEQNQKELSDISYNLSDDLNITSPHRENEQKINDNQIQENEQQQDIEMKQINDQKNENDVQMNNEIKIENEQIIDNQQIIQQENIHKSKTDIVKIENVKTDNIQIETNNELVEEVSLRSMIDYIQKLIAWFRGYVNFEEIFQNKKLKKKFYSFLQKLVMSYSRALKYNDIELNYRDKILKNQQFQEFKSAIQQLLHFHNQSKEPNNQYQYNYDEFDQLQDEDIDYSVSSSVKKQKLGQSEAKNKFYKYHQQDSSNRYMDQSLVKFRKPLKNLEKRRIEKLRQAISVASTQQKKDKIYEVTKNLNNYLQESYQNSIKKQIKQQKSFDLQPQNIANNIDKNLEQNKKIEYVEFKDINFDLKSKQKNNNQTIVNKNIFRNNLFNMDIEEEQNEEKHILFEYQPLQQMVTSIDRTFDDKSFTYNFYLRQINQTFVTNLNQHFELDKIFLLEFSVYTLLENLDEQNEKIYQDLEKILLDKHNKNHKILDDIQNNIKSNISIQNPKFIHKNSIAKDIMIRKDLTQQFQKEVKINRIVRIKALLVLNKNEQIQSQNQLKFQFQNQVSIQEKDQFMDLKYYKYKYEQDLLEFGTKLKHSIVEKKFQKFKFYDVITNNMINVNKKIKNSDCGIYYEIENPQKILVPQRKQKDVNMEEKLKDKYTINFSLWTTFNDLSKLKLSINNFHVL